MKYAVHLKPEPNYNMMGTIPGKVVVVEGSAVTTDGGELGITDNHVIVAIFAAGTWQHVVTS